MPHGLPPCEKCVARESGTPTRVSSRGCVDLRCFAKPLGVSPFGLPSFGTPQALQGLGGFPFERLFPFAGRSHTREIPIIGDALKPPTPVVGLAHHQNQLSCPDAVQRQRHCLRTWTASWRRHPWILWTLSVRFSSDAVRALSEDAIGCRPPKSEDSSIG